MAGKIRFLSKLNANSLDGDTTQSWVTLTRVGEFSDPRYGRFRITRQMLLSIVDNFDKGTYGQKIFIDVAHRHPDGAAGEIIKLTVEDGKLRALVEWTPFGIQSIREKKYVYLSAEYHENFKDNEAGAEHGPVLFGAALTIRPVIKHQAPIELSETDGVDAPLLISPTLLSELTQEVSIMWKTLMATLVASLQSFKLSEVTIKSMTDTAEKALAGITDEAQAKLLLASFENTGKQLAEQIGNQPATIQLSMPSAGGLTAEDVKRLMAEESTRQADSARQLTEKRDANLKLLTDAIGAVKDFDEATRKELTESVADLITADMSADQVKRFADTQIAMGNKIASAKKLSAMGYQFSGSSHISVDSGNDVKALQQQIITGLRESSSFGAGKLKLLAEDKLHPFVAKVLSAFDGMQASRLHAEHKLLSGGTTGMADTNLPAGFQRTVIREALSDLRVLELVQTMTDPAATITTGIPYEQRDMSAVYNDGVVFEGQGIHRASISQAMDYAYINPMKLAFLISNEVVHFTRAGMINWDAYGRNVESNARVMRELIVRRICNEMQRAADAYLAVAVTGENIASQLDGSTKHTIKTANFPIVRPFQQKDIKGTNVGSAENAVALVVDDEAITAWDGTGAQSAGTYYRVLSYNLGYIQFVNQAGTPVTPAAGTGASTIGYSKATNVLKFDLDNGSTELGLHLNGLLRAIGSRKAVMKDDRYITPDFLLMSNTLNDTCTNAEAFTAASKRDGSATGAQGDLETVKGVPAWATNAPGVDLGDERILMGVRGTLSYTVAKPFVTGEPFEAVDSNGKPTGQKQAYGEEYSAIKVPSPVRNRFTSVLAYSASGR